MRYRDRFTKFFETGVFLGIGLGLLLLVLFAVVRCNGS